MAKYTVKSGDSWASISRKLYGGDERYFNVLMQQNAGISMLQPGMVIRAPNLDSYIQSNRARGILHNVSQFDINRARSYDARVGYEGGLSNVGGTTGGGVARQGTQATPLTSANAGSTVGVAGGGLNSAGQVSGFIGREGTPQSRGYQPLSGPTGQYGRGGPTRRGRGRDTSRFRTAWLQRQAQQRGSGGSGWQQQSPYRPQEPRTPVAPRELPQSNYYQNNWLGDFNEFTNEMSRQQTARDLATEARDRDRGRHSAAGVRGRYDQAREVWEDTRQDRGGMAVGTPAEEAAGLVPRRTYPQGGPQGPRWEGDADAYRKRLLSPRGPGQLAGYTRRTSVAPAYRTPEEHRELVRGMDIMGYKPIFDANGNVVGYEPVRRKDWDGRPIRNGKPWNPLYRKEPTDVPAASSKPYYPWTSYTGGDYSYKRPVRAFRPMRGPDGRLAAPATQYRRPSASQYRPPASRPVYRNVRPDARAYIGATSWRIF